MRFQLVRSVVRELMYTKWSPHPLLSIENVCATPDIAGLTYETSKRRACVCAQNVTLVINGLAPNFRVIDRSRRPDLRSDGPLHKNYTSRTKHEGVRRSCESCSDADSKETSLIDIAN